MVATAYRYFVHGGLEGSPANRVQLTTDGHKAYLKAVAEVDSMPTMRC